MASGALLVPKIIPLCNRGGHKCIITCKGQVLGDLFLDKVIVTFFDPSMIA